MVNNLKLFDSHIHIGDPNLCRQILDATIYKNKYKLYSCIDPQVVEETDLYLQQLEAFYAMPMIFKEVSVAESNIYLSNVITKYNNGIGVFLLVNNNDDLGIYNLNILKEHFLLHHEEEWLLRSDSYDFLNSTEGYLILHCRDRVRIPYVDFLRKQFPNMNIILAHMGRNVFNDYSFNTEVIEHFKNDGKIIMDVSTVEDINIIKMGVKLLGTDRVLFGSDFPFSVSPGVKVEKFLWFLQELGLRESEINKIVYDNSLNIAKILKKV